VTRRNQAQAALAQAQVTLQNMRTAVRTAEAHVNEAQAGVQQSQEKYASLQSDVKQQQAKTTQAQAGVQQAGSSYGALQAAISQQQARVTQATVGVLQARSNAAALQADVLQRQAQIAQAQAALQGTYTAPEQISSSQAQAQSARAKVLQARAQVDQLLLQLSYTRILAPHDGVVSRKSVDLGQTVQNGQQLMVLADLGSADVTANYKETQLEGMRVGSPAEVEVDAYPGHVFHGHVVSLSAGTGAVFSLLPPENASGNFTKVVQRVPVKIAIDAGIDANHPLRLGMSVEATVDIGTPRQEKRSQQPPQSSEIMQGTPHPTSPEGGGVLSPLPPGGAGGGSEEEARTRSKQSQTQREQQ
jgi:membrane fusion protein (multidrug efflux system)